MSAAPIAALPVLRMRRTLNSLQIPCTRYTLTGVSVFVSAMITRKMPLALVRTQCLWNRSSVSLLHVPVPVRVPSAAFSSPSASP